MYEKNVVLGMLPELSRNDNGTPVTSPEQWNARRRELLGRPLTIEFGGMPPMPEKFGFEQLSREERRILYRITAGTSARTCSFDAEIFLPEDFNEGRRYPVILTGDGCWREKYCGEKIQSGITGCGYLFVLFDRTAYAPDDGNRARSEGIYEVYGSDAPFSTISAWAWGYSRVVDLLLTLPFVDADFIGITGHSRGGKTVLLAGAVDERIRFVNPNCSGTHGCGCYRYETHVDPAKPGDDERSEPLSYMVEVVPYWLGEELKSYAGRETELPYDMHFFKALIAPRYFLETEAEDDTWANPVGSYQTFLAAKEAFRLLGAEDHAKIVYRSGGHGHSLNDYLHLVHWMDAMRDSTPVPEELDRSYYPGLEPIF